MHNGHLNVNGVWLPTSVNGNISVNGSDQSGSFAQQIRNVNGAGTPNPLVQQAQQLAGSPSSSRDSPYGGAQVSEQNLYGTTYFISEAAKQQTIMYPPYMAYPGFNADTSLAFLERTIQQKTNARTSFFMGEEYRQYLLSRHIESRTSVQDQTVDGVMTKAFPDITPTNSASKESYHSLYPLEQLLESKSQTLLAQTSTFRATRVEDGLNYCLKRIHGCRNYSQDGFKNLARWQSIRHANIVTFHTAFTIKAFGDSSIMFVYDYHPTAETLMQRHFMPSANPWKQKRQPVTEPVVWNYIVQLTSAIRTIHSSNLAYRQLFPTNIIVTGKARLRLNYSAVLDMMSGSKEELQRHKQDDLFHLGRLLLALCCNSTQPFQGDVQVINQCAELVRKSFSADLFKLISYLLKPSSTGKSVDALMPMIGARFYTQFDSALLWGDMIEGELEKELENGRLFRLLSKMSMVQCQPPAGAVLGQEQSWSESGERRLVRLFRNYLFRQRTDQGNPFLSLSHVIASLNKLDVGSDEKIILNSNDDRTVILATYNDIKSAINKCFMDLCA